MTMRNLINKYNKDYYGGGLMMLLGLGAVVQGRTYNIGTLSKMGPGFFPVALGTMLMLVGAAIALTAKSSVSAEEEKHLRPEWRGWICIALSIVAFVVLGRYGGLLPATFAIVFISAMGDRKNSLKSACLLSLAMVAVCVVVFWWALKMQFPLFQWG
ncbi:tripartite tricarboxylate transporter TctB family protein [Glaciimonas sp. Gout2]|uniref:tripartite tricarboxylate transporter TctB family protein n=1 Tax=unclassified Glaciimonas TaxID=2644401 RepID=UPI002B239084|nr:MULTISPECIES: tripartite tricarboxylate transporter TctB family protein [unclassified Glaciimonas]MEB0011233.1 tripartite tricarboxylate transporter TctB family protein [Glaciimonas sp. Cout2]MEB0080883.1 tripartite tricarboxylate transporter TctB family protein [Glaciimonas sp. Gout2]